MHLTKTIVPKKRPQLGKGAIAKCTRNCKEAMVSGMQAMSSVRLEK